MALLLPIYPGQAAPVWPAAGIALSGVLLFGQRIWPGIFLGSFVATVPMFLDTTSIESLLRSLLPPMQFGGAAVIEALLGAYLMRRGGGFGENVAQPETVFKTMLLGGPVACFVGATAGTAGLFLTGTVLRGDLLLQWRNYWIGDTVGVLVVIPLVFLWGTELRRGSLQTRLGVVLPIMASLALTSVAAFYVRQDEKQQTRTEFERRTELMARAFEHAAASHLDIVQSVTAFFSSSNNVTRGEFQNFASPPLERHPDLHGLSWNAIVSADEREGFEERARQRGFAEFRITEQGTDGGLVPAARRDQHVVVYFIEPYKGNEQALGYDLSSNPVRQKALERARDSGQISATQPILLVQETEQKPGLLLFAPIYSKGAPTATTTQRRANIDSFVSAVFKAEQLVETALQAFAGEGIGYEVTDITDSDHRLTLYQNASHGRHSTGLLAPLEQSTDVTLAGRLWRMRFWPTQSYQAASKWARIWVVLPGGVLFTSLLGAFLLVVAGRTAAAERASESEERFQTLLREVDDVVWAAAADGSGMLYVNPACERVYGRPAVDFFERPGLWSEAVHPDDRDRVQQEANELFAQGRVNQEYRIVRPNGEVRWLSDRKHLILDEAGKPIRMGGLATDITERVQAGEEREAFVEELERKNAELERFTYTVSHDLKAPLVTIAGFLGLIEKDIDQGNFDRVLQNFTHIKTATDKMRRLLRELLELSRIGRLGRTPEEVSLTELAHEAAEMVAGQLEASGITVEIDPAMPVAFGDRVRLLEVYQNLLENAVKFTRDQATPRVEIGMRREKGEDLFYVRDNGQGIDPRYHEKVFGLFEQLSPRTEGTGIGLALVKRIVEVHGGRIWVESEGAGHGSTFWFTLPGDGKAQQGIEDVRSIQTDGIRTHDPLRQQ
jgi:PAS domain S-box-containing protein